MVSIVLDNEVVQLHEVGTREGRVEFLNLLKDNNYPESLNLMDSVKNRLFDFSTIIRFFTEEEILSYSNEQFLLKMAYKLGEHVIQYSTKKKKPDIDKYLNSIGIHKVDKIIWWFYLDNGRPSKVQITRVGRR